MQTRHQPAHEVGGDQGALEGGVGISECVQADDRVLREPADSATQRVLWRGVHNQLALADCTGGIGMVPV